MQIVPSLPSDVDQLVAMFAEYNFALQKRSWWEWKYNCNPHGRAKSFKILVDGAIVGAVAVMPQLFDFNNKKFVGIQAVDGLMGREIRGKHLFNDVMAFLLQSRPDGVDSDFFYLSFPSLQSSIRAHENAGWKRLADGLLFKFPLRVASLEHVKGLYRFRALLAPFFSVYRRILAGRAPSGYRAQEITRFESHMVPDLPADKVRGIRSAELLNWRVFENSRDQMRAFTIDDGQHTVGYFVCKQQQETLEIVEARFVDPNPKHLLTMLRHVIQQDLAASVDLMMFDNHRNAALLPRSGFLRRRFTGTVFVTDSQSTGLPADHRQWEISYLDSDW